MTPSDIFLLLLQLAFIKHSTQKSTSLGCYLDISNRTDGASLPLLLSPIKKNFELIVPTRGAVTLQKGESVILACPGAKNHLENGEVKEVEATCKGRNKLEIDKHLLYFEDAKCSKYIHADVRKLSKECGERGNQLLIGYRLEKTDEWLPLIHVCYDYSAGATLYTQHELNGQKIKYTSKSTVRPSFSTTGLPSDVAASIAYKTAFQKSTFNSLLGSASKAEKYINDSSFLSTGHLSPKADFIYISLQRSTYFYINACPQWQIINNGNWKSIETLVRRTVESYNKTFQIVTGTYDILELPNYRDLSVPITLQRGKLPVPKYIWKIVHDAESKKGIALVVLNNPFATIHHNPEFCQNICNIYGWGRSQWHNIRKGYVFCCKVTDFRKIVKTVPNISVREVLQGIL